MTTTTLSSRVGSALTPKKITANSKSNFALSFLFLPKKQRQGITNFYALSRVIDDAVDDHGPEEGEELLAFWKNEINLCYQGKPTHPIMQAMQQTINSFQIPKKYLDLLVEGCEMDLKKNRYQTFEELYQYCYRVAGVIGLICMKIFGMEGDKAEQAAEELGIALQLTNIIRDIKTDAQMGRIYISQEDLGRYRLTEQELIEGRRGAKFFSLMKLMTDRAETYFNRAFTKMRAMPRRPLWAAWIMGKTYEKLLIKIRQKKFDVFSKKITLSKPVKFWILFKEITGISKFHS